ncbi:arrestin-related trafficking adapter [Arthroderma uncinatum]|uniref:arrestin-related trafficking adapter n=1 Tax=Arthroderma uncinatum TaxID=74035 RepID=UPI00144A56DD|nr:arrestin-related trafficking adapter [Arthroderma uncinatum]KAF3483186.1 arrestin-related trafficking adapter [Arthroderma uncinatum]
MGGNEVEHTFEEHTKQLADTSRRGSRSCASSLGSSESNSVPIPDSTLPSFPHERIVASGNGIVVLIGLAEPVLFLERFDRRVSSGKKCVISGSLHLKITKSTKIKKINLGFKGIARTFWPEGIPGDRKKTRDTETVINLNWDFFDAQARTATRSYGANHIKFTVSNKKVSEGSPSAADLASLFESSVSLPKELRRLSLHNARSDSFGKGDSHSISEFLAQRSYKTFPPGEYMYNFEIPMEHQYPETVKWDNASVKYELEAVIERAGAFRPNLVGIKEIPLIRTPGEDCLEHVEPIAISRTWDNKLHYDVVITGKSFPLGSKIPVAIKLTPISKVGCHRVSVFLTEKVQLWAHDRKVHCVASDKVLLLFEKRAGIPCRSVYPGGTMRLSSGGGQAITPNGEDVVGGTMNFLGDTNHESFGMGTTELECEVQLPSCPVMKRVTEASLRLHCDVQYSSIEISHSVKVVFRLSKPDGSPYPKRRRQFDISIDSPLGITSCKASASNIYLPAYNSPSSYYTDEYECGCPDAANLARDVNANPTLSLPPTFAEIEMPPPPTFNESSSNSYPSDTHQHERDHNDPPTRPIHFIRAPSFNPPPFESVPPPPPPLISPPPAYSTIFSGGPGLNSEMDDYFARAHVREGEYDDNVRGTGRVDIPLTPGGRVHRSMDVPRECLANGSLPG